MKPITLDTMRTQDLPPAGAGPAVLACGAWLKNSACLRQGDRVHWSPVHGDLGDPANCVALERSVAELAALGGGAIAAVAHDLHPDFFSSQLALRVATELGVPAIAVQHHHAHIGALLAEYGLQRPVVGLALDGVGLGTDGVAWGGELLWLDGAQWRREGHLGTLALPGGDAAAREPWRMAASALHALGRGGEIAERFGAAVGNAAAQTVQTMLARSLNCPLATGAGRWFDAAAGALRISVRQAFEAEAAIALEKLAADYLAAEGDADLVGAYEIDADGVLDLRPLLAQLFELADGGADGAARGAALFHVALADALASWAERAARRRGVQDVALGGGCFFNRVLTERLSARLKAGGMQVWLPQSVSCGDAGLALGQAWVARQMLGAR